MILWGLYTFWVLAWILLFLCGIALIIVLTANVRDD